MKQYNIYAGITNIDDSSYQYTTLCNSQEEATNEAYKCACEKYNRYNLCNWDDVVSDYCSRNDKTNLDEEDYKKIELTYDSIREDWLIFYATPTKDDNIDQDNLILDYIVEDDLFSSVSSE